MYAHHLGSRNAFVSQGIKVRLANTKICVSIIFVTTWVHAFSENPPSAVTATRVRSETSANIMTNVMILHAKIMASVSS